MRLCLLLFFTRTLPVASTTNIRYACSPKLVTLKLKIFLHGYIRHIRDILQLCVNHIAAALKQTTQWREEQTSEWEKASSGSPTHPTDFQVSRGTRLGKAQLFSFCCAARMQVSPPCWHVNLIPPPSPALERKLPGKIIF